MDVVIAGGTGSLGRPLSAALLGAGHTVTVLSRQPSPQARSDSVTWDPAQPNPDAAWVQRLCRADAVVNLAGESIGGHGPLPVRWTPRLKAELRSSRLEATQAVVSAIETAPPERRPKLLVNASAVGYYGSRGDELLTESSGPGQDFLARLCVDWEAAARKAEPLGVRVVTVRTGLVLAPNDMATRLLVLSSKLGVGGPLGSGRQWWSWIHRDDVVGILVHALCTETVRGPMNAVAPAPRRQRDFARVLGGLQHRPSIMPAPAIALRLALGEIADALLLASQRVAPEKALETGYGFRYTSLEQALSAVLGT